MTVRSKEEGNCHKVGVEREMWKEDWKNFMYPHFSYFFEVKV